jgi:hypothetical protein
MTDAPLNFLPWLRLGLAAQIDDVAVAGLAPGVTTSASVALSVQGSRPTGEVDTVELSPRQISLLGPGAVTGIDTAEILRRWPDPNVTDAETNYFAFVELNSPDFPWRYTPAAADADDRLQPWLALVVVEDRDGVTIEDSGGTGCSALTIDDVALELPPASESWAWAHVQVDDDLADGVEAAWLANPAAFRSRLVCPRRLDADRAWLVCIVPTFEAGRRAGLGLDGADSTGLAWGTSGGVTLPVYDYWRFVSGPDGDFESLVEKLTPRELGPEVGVKDLDVSDGGSSLPVLDGAVVSFTGALVSPTTMPVELAEDDQATLAAAITALVDADADPVEVTEYDPLTDDPVVAPARYGTTQTRRRSLPTPGDEPVWFGELNTEPSHRVVAGLGASVVRTDQESLMDDAWDQAAELAAVNRRITQARLAVQVSTRLAARATGLDDARFVGHAAGLLGRVKTGSGTTALADYRTSAVATGLSSGAFRRMARPGRGIGSRLGLEAPAVEVTKSFLDDPSGPISTFRTIVAPLGADVGAPVDATPDETAAAFAYIGAMDAGLLEVTLASSPVTFGSRTVPFGAMARAVTTSPALGVGALVRGATGPMVTSMVVARPVEATWATVVYDAPASVEWIEAVRDAIDPSANVAALTRAQLTLPEGAWTGAELPARLSADPEFPSPLYERVVATLGVDHLVPGIGDVENETVGLLVTNDAYVEAFLVGANHEMAREFLWREYPTLLTGTWFHQFWNGTSPDVPDIADFDGSAALGEQGTRGAADLVVVLKGTFPRRYPDVRVYAVEAAWVSTEPPRRDEDPDGGVRSPVFAGQLAADTLFYGFDLDLATARGSTDVDEHPGWFFVFEERPAGVRFGLDVGDPSSNGVAPSAWSELSWASVTASGAGTTATTVDLGATTWLTAAGPLEGNGGTDAWAEDAAAMARITLQRPARLLVHADSMLPETS